VYVISPGRKLEIDDTSISASPFTEPRSRRAPIDVLFRSLAESCGDGFAVILSGGGTDGMLGARAVKEAGGLVLVQDPSEALHEAMARASTRQRRSGGNSARHQRGRAPPFSPGESSRSPRGSPSSAAGRPSSHR